METASQHAPSAGGEITCPDCGSVFDAKPKGKQRSLPQHRRLHGIIGTVFKNWPADHEFTPESEDHLRAWLVVKAGPEFRYVDHINCPYAEGEPSVTRLIAISMESSMRMNRERGAYSFVRPHPDGGSVAVYSAKSTKFNRMPHLMFCALSSAIDDVLHAEGIDPEKMHQNAEAEAA